MMCVSNPSTWEAEDCHRFETSLGYIANARPAVLYREALSQKESIEV